MFRYEYDYQGDADTFKKEVSKMYLDIDAIAFTGREIIIYSSHALNIDAEEKIRQLILEFDRFN